MQEVTGSTPVSPTMFRAGAGARRVARRRSNWCNRQVEACFSPAGPTGQVGFRAPDETAGGQRSRGGALRGDRGGGFGRLFLFGGGLVQEV